MYVAKAFLTKVDTGFVKKKCDNKGIERGFDSIKTCYALQHFSQKWIPV
jgi:hypothetical protein